MAQLNEVYVGVDIGSTAVRVGLVDSDGVLVSVEKERISYQISAVDSRFITQSSSEILSSFHKCFTRVKEKLRMNDVIRSISCAATCSLVVMRNIDGTLHPYPVDYGFKDEYQNIVFWMDSRAREETQFVNRTLSDSETLKYYGGSFIEEMAIPKIKYLIDHIPCQVLPDIVFFDLHDYLLYEITRDGYRASKVSISNSVTQRALDGAVKGWSQDFLRSIGLVMLADNNFRSIGRVEQSREPFSAIPLAGSIIGGTIDGISVCQGVIDSYGGWLGSCGASHSGCLTMVAGTSTCYLVGHKSLKPVHGIWGPFEGIFPDHYVSEGGQTTTGKLIEHLFDSHPAFHEIDQLDKFGDLEKRIQTMETEIGGSIHFLSRKMFLYGDLSGNRTPYCDSSMRGVFFGESIDLTVTDLILKYVCILEFLAFQTKQVVDMMCEYDIRKIVVCGSQAKNKRLVELISLVTGLPVEVRIGDSEFSGIIGAAYLAMSGYKEIPLQKLLQDFDNPGNTSYAAARTDGLLDLLNTKYKIMLDIAERQIHYRQMIDKVIS